MALRESSDAAATNRPAAEDNPPHPLRQDCRQLLPTHVHPPSKHTTPCCPDTGTRGLPVHLRLLCLFEPAATSQLTDCPSCDFQRVQPEPALQPPPPPHTNCLLRGEPSTRAAPAGCGAGRQIESAHRWSVSAQRCPEQPEGEETPHSTVQVEKRLF